MKQDVRIKLLDNKDNTCCRVTTEHCQPFLMQNYLKIGIRDFKPTFRDDFTYAQIVVVASHCGEADELFMVVGLFLG